MNNITELSNIYVAKLDETLSNKFRAFDASSKSPKRMDELVDETLATLLRLGKMFEAEFHAPAFEEISREERDEINKAFEKQMVSVASRYMVGLYMAK